MHIRNSIPILLTMAAMTAALNAQAPAVAPGAQAPPAAANQQAAGATPAQSAGATTATDLLQPALANARATLMALKVEKWKKGTVRDEADANVKTLIRDLDNNVPALVATADAAPGRLSSAIPLIKHLDALYDVMLRVEEGSRVSAPGDQVDALQKALLRVSQARNAYDDVLQTQAAGAEKQMGDLETAARTAQQSVKDAQRDVELARAAAKSEPCKPATPARRKRSTAAAGAQAKPAAQPGQKPAAQPGQKPAAQPGQKPAATQQPGQKPAAGQQPQKPATGQQQPAKKPQ